MKVRSRRPVRWATTLAVVVITVAMSTGAVASSLFTLDFSTGSWKNVVGRPIDFNPALVEIHEADDNNGEALVLWGLPLTSESPKSGLGFTGVGETEIEVDTPFQVGTLRHYNNIVFSGNIHTVDLDLTLEFSEPGLTWSTTLSFEIDETPNVPTDCPDEAIPCPDFIFLPDSFGTDAIIHDGRKYGLEIVGFQDPISGDLVSILVSQEEDTTIALLIAQIVDVSHSVEITNPVDEQVFALSGGDVALSAEITDPLGSGGAVFTCEIDWGDGTVTPGSVVANAEPPTCDGAHEYSSSGIYSIMVTVEDEFGITDDDTVSIYVDVAPSIQANVTGTLGNNDWYTSDVEVSWTIQSLSPLLTTSGCDDATIDTDTSGTTISCTAENGAGETTQSVTIKRDATAPALVLPDDQVLPATSAAGAEYNFTPAANDNLDPDPTVTCDRGSGVFPIGTTTVNCEATDAAGNAAQGSFTVQVLSAPELVEDLQDSLDGMDLPNNVKRSLQAKLDAAEASIAKGNITPACNQLQAFINDVEAQRGKGLTNAQADLLVNGAQAIRTAIGC